MPRVNSSLIQYTNVAATTVRDIAESAHVPFLVSVAVLSLSITKNVQLLKANREECFRMVEQIHEILCAIVKQYSNLQMDGVLPPKLLHDIGNFAQTLQKLHVFIEAQQRMGKIRQFIKQLDINLQIRSCKTEMQIAVDTFRVQSGISVPLKFSELKQDEEERHKELLALLEANPDLTKSEQGLSSVTGTLSSVGNSSGSLSMLPGCPQIFHGRERELQELVDVLQDDEARIAILGPGGIGKTSLATAVLHHEHVVNKYSSRYFVPCHLASTTRDLVAVIANHIGLEPSPNIARKILQHLTYSEPPLLVLDNFETPWESTTSRSGVEDFLAHLAEISHLAIIITMRGVELPGKIKWTQPFFKPLKSLSNTAALETFLDIADETHGTEEIMQLLAMTGNIPLAICLIASVAVFEGCPATLNRWEREKTLLLSNGHDKRSSLDISIMLSFSSPRMTSGAQDLLSILSILPDGLSDPELVQSGLPIPNILASKSKLIATSLAYIDQGHRLKVSVPVREYMQTNHPPSPTMKFAFRQYCHQLIRVWTDFRSGSSGNTLFPIMINAGNLRAVFLDALTMECQDEITNIRSALSFLPFCRIANHDHVIVMQAVSSRIMHWKEDAVYGEFLVESVQSMHVKPDEIDAMIRTGNSYFQSVPDTKKARWYSSLGSYYFDHMNDVSLGLHYFRGALDLADKGADNYPSRTGRWALDRIASILNHQGNHSEARSFAQKAQKYAEYLGDPLAQAQSTYVEATCCCGLSDFQSAFMLCQRARNILLACGLGDGSTYFYIKTTEVDIHIQKTEYKEAEDITLSIIASHSPGKPATFSYGFALLNLALINIQTRALEETINQNLKTAKHIFSTVVPVPLLVLYCDTGIADLALREGNLRCAQSQFAKCFALSCNLQAIDASLFCLERLADHHHRMDSLTDTLQWAAVFLALSYKTNNKLALHKALQCLGNVFVCFQRGHWDSSEPVSCGI
ncbi:hypothetical protein DFH07DRAFT_925515 [Mycena maculata]|uniref:Novel STAND NTPase 1 domain-containing protein n=1 Tax=Mycena maculata TaxID=230809 RepID=A0AAD7IGP8_9AGAR|nr:hypothetical protein DFH07DRAFT_925515 [Mycena maculata]